MEKLEDYSGEIYFEVLGDGEPILLIHGIDSDRRVWDKQVLELAEEYKTIRFDLRGFGKSDMPKGNFSNNEDILNLLNELGIEKVNLVGYSFGGTIAPHFAIEHPERVKRISLISPGLISYKWSKEIMDYFQEFQTCLRDGKHSDALNLLYWKTVYGPNREQKGLEEISEKLGEMFSHALTIPRLGSLKPFPFEMKQLKQIEAPTLIMIGEKDFTDYHDIAQIYNQEIPNSTITIIKGSGHLLNLEAPDQVNRAIKEFIS
jgi:3-oxoadipate enol-lactonase